MSILTRGAVDLYALFEWGLTIFKYGSIDEKQDVNVELLFYNESYTGNPKLEAYRFHDFDVLFK
jgi:hypothetical protein